MTSTTFLSEDLQRQGFREYRRSESAVFRKTKEELGGLSNMASGFPVEVNDVFIRTVEALYQACRYPDYPEIQLKIVDQSSPMTAKMVGKPFRDHTRPDWSRTRTQIMRWSLRVKLLQNWDAFASLLLHTGERPIVEESRKDDFWGAKPIDDDVLIGRNVLGRLLMELREEIKTSQVRWNSLPPPAIENFRLLGEMIKEVHATQIREVHGRVVENAQRYREPLSQRQISGLDIPPRHESRNGRLRPYPEYKSSGVLWLGEVPAHWELVPNRYLMRQRREIVGLASDDWTLLSLTLGGIVPRDMENPQGKFPANFETYQVVEPGDLVFCLFDVDETPRTVGLSKHRGMVTGAYDVFRPFNEQLAGYLYLLYLSLDAHKSLRPLYKGLRKVIPKDSFLSAKSVVPPLDEQAAIVKYLAHVDRKITRFIRAKRRMIELLNEQKQALIHQAVTKGLDPDVPMKDSGVEWLGEIPAHWEMPALGFRYSVELGKMLDGKRITGDSLVPYLRNTDVQWDRINIADLPAMDIFPGEYDRYTLQEGDLLVCEGGEVGRAAFWNCELPICGYQKALHRLRPLNDQKDRPRFLYFLLFLLAKRGIFAASGNESTIVHLTGVQLRAYRLPFPPTEEQKAIVAHIQSESSSIDESIGLAQREIDLIREYRTRLVSDVVTGKVDVREATAGMPEIEDMGDDEGIQGEWSLPDEVDADEPVSLDPNGNETW